jgi:hypothetical protein
MGTGDKECGRKGKLQSLWATGKGYRVADKKEQETSTSAGKGVASILSDRQRVRMADKGNRRLGV